jgi:lysophospholipase L1-like esterase
MGADVHFDAPATAGGRGPYRIECNPGSSSIFPIGETIVRCTVTDADMAQASCAFPVTVRVSQTISVTKFTAFGDSITDGKVSLVPLISLAGPDTYPYKLGEMLQQKYASQTIIVSNQGVSGEHLGQGATRLPDVLDAEKPDVLLLLEGVNAVWIRATTTQAANIRTMLTAARQRDVDVIIATVMPVSAQWEADGHVGSMARIRALNTRIVQLAADFGIEPVVDLFAIFEANPGLIGSDGLHPTVEGQTRIAEAFRDEIVRRYESRSTTSFSFSTMRQHDGR